jgi:5'(3')-deoxyribonucleotidase
MRIGIDFDGVIVDIHELMVRYSVEEMRVPLRPDQIMRPHGPNVLGENGYAELLKATHSTPLALTVRPVPGALETLRLLTSRHELVLITARTGAQLDYAERWLAAHDLSATFADIVSSHGVTKAEVESEVTLDALLDDHLPNLAGLRTESLSLLFTAPHNLNDEVSAPTRRVADWGEVARVVESH